MDIKSFEFVIKVEYGIVLSLILFISSELYLILDVEVEYEFFSVNSFISDEEGSKVISVDLSILEVFILFEISCEYIFLAVTPNRAIEWLKENSKNISSKTVVIDCCGTKGNICEEGFRLASENNYRFVGGHPMAGKQVGGYKNSSPNLFEGAMFAIVPNEETEDKSDINLIMGIQKLLKEIGFTEFAVMSPSEHDRIIAFTSQMPHLISNAYIKSDLAEIGAGTRLSGGSFRDMTRVAYLDPEMWTELFMENKVNLISELDKFIEELEKYREAIANADESNLTNLLLEGRKRKEEIEKEGTTNNRKVDVEKGKPESETERCTDDCIECKLMV